MKNTPPSRESHHPAQLGGYLARHSPRYKTGHGTNIPERPDGRQSRLNPVDGRFWPMAAVANAVRCAAAIRGRANPRAEAHAVPADPSAQPCVGQTATAGSSSASQGPCGGC
jgi:hypothetical protein